ncbi:MAG: sigma-54-dependent Fis family transcriptional regulator [Sedimentisphaerales bacterium]|nr:sigma-54-dependent Fis family transcriptional regulator [Sedimentisphaerales bacterium]
MTSTNKGTVLLVEDDAASREATAVLLARRGFSVVKASHGQQALTHFADGISVIITDLVMPQIDGMELLRIAREELPHTPVIVLTGQGSEAAAVEALKAGAFYYLTKPVNPDELLSLIGQAVEKYRLASEIAALHQHLNKKYGFGNLIGRSEPMRKVFERIKMAADARSTVLIHGESGTGKELVARALHLNSPRRKKPFIAINCAAIPEALVESELFGHEKGAFTGAVSARTGKFQAAEGGTLLVDEIGEMPLDLQSKLLRAIETRSINPVGGNREISVDVRIVASTHRDLETLVKEGKFRDDLFYRLNVVNIWLPPLRERKDDIPLLARAFIDEIAAENNRPARDLTSEALAYLQAYDWPGNVRQLRNVLESIIVMSSRDVVDVADLPEAIRGARPRRSIPSVVRPGMTMSQIEKAAIAQALDATDGNRREVSRMLGISVRTLQRKIKEYGLSLS